MADKVNVVKFKFVPEGAERVVAAFDKVRKATVRNEPRIDPFTGLGTTKFGGVRVKKGPVYSPDRTLVPYDPAFAQEQIRRRDNRLALEQSRAFWQKKRDAIAAEYYDRARARGYGPGIVYYGHRKAGKSVQYASEMAREYTTAAGERDQERRNRLSIAEQRREERSLSARARVRSNKDKLMRVRTLRTQGRMREADELLYRGEGYGSTSSDLVNALDQERQRKAQEREQRQQERQARRMQRIAERNQRQAEKDEARRRRDAERAYQQQNRDENFDARQQALDARDAERAQIRAEKDEARRQKAAQRVLARNDRLRSSLKAKEEREALKQSKLANKLRGQVVKGMARLTSGLGALKSAGALGALGYGVVNAAGTIFDQISKVSDEVIANSNFTKYRGISATDAAKLSFASKRFGVDDGALKGFIGNLSQQLAMSGIKKTELVKNAAFWGLDIYDKNGNIADVMTVFQRMGHKAKGLTGNDKQQFMQMFGIDENMIALIEGMRNGFNGGAGGDFSSLWGQNAKAVKHAQWVANYKDLFDKDVKKDYAEGRWFKAFFTGTIPQKLRMDSFFAELDWGKFRDAMKERGTAADMAAIGEPYLSSAQFGSGNQPKSITVNLGGQNFTLTGNTTKEILKEVQDKFGEEFAKTVVNQLQIYDKN